MPVEWNAVPRALEEALRRRQPAQLRIAGSGTVCLYPDQDCYVSDIQDWEAACVAPAVDVTLAPSAWAAAPATCRPITELRWRALLHCLKQQGGEPVAARYELLRLQSWPDLPRVPEDLMAPLARICALLWRKPTVAYLVARTLQMPERDTALLLRALRGFGHLAASVLAVPSGAEADADTAAAAQNAAAAAPMPSVLAKLWQRLLGAQPA